MSAAFTFPGVQVNFLFSSLPRCEIEQWPSRDRFDSSIPAYLSRATMFTPEDSQKWQINTEPHLVFTEQPNQELSVEEESTLVWEKNREKELLRDTYKKNAVNSWEPVRKGVKRINTSVSQN